MTWKTFERELAETLARLYDPDYQPSETLSALLGLDPRQGSLAVQSAVIRAIADLEPPPGAPPTAHARKVYDVLYNRYVLKLTQEETAERLHASRSSVQRAQREAVHSLARTLWEGGEREGEEKAVAAQASSWQNQMRRELASLQARAPDAVSDVGEIIAGVLGLENSLTAQRDVRVEVGFVQPHLIAAIHPSALRQILIAAVGRLARRSPPGQITIFAGLEDGNVKITLVGPLSPDDTLDEGDLLHDMLAPENVSLAAHVESDHVYLWVGVPSVNKIGVLVVDDNPDTADFYRRCAEGTSYHIVHVAEGRGLFPAIESSAPDVIVLDVMLPDADGWELLMRLRENPATRSLPVIVCSVIREEGLALSLGAARYLMKPIQPREFIQALDRVLAQAPGAASKAPASSGATD